VAGAQEEFRTLLVERGEDRLRHLGRCPKFSDYAELTYKPRLATLGKKADTLVTEHVHLKQLKASIGHLHLDKIKAAVAASLGLELAARVLYYQPQEFIANLQVLAPQVPKAPEVTEIRRGYKIKTTLPKLTQEEQRQREDAALSTVIAILRKA